MIRITREILDNVMDVFELDEFFAKFDRMRAVGDITGQFHSDVITETCKGKFREESVVMTLNPTPSGRGTNECTATLQEAALDETRRGER